ncbi:MAG TPA: hypothetical protein PKA17_01115, partial [Phenylobacterium sp.]|nr:hypothetical protein [Phenylobacterium sp.]
TDAGIESSTERIASGSAEAQPTQGERTEDSEGTIKELTPEDEAREAIARFERACEAARAQARAAA